jgi:hypothetical protein
MRFIRTFILRLYTDPEMREKICGDVQALPGCKPHPFKNYTELLDRLHQLTNKDNREMPMRGSEDKN